MANDTDLMTAIIDRDAAVVRRHVLDREFILINVVDDEEDDDEDQMGALTAEINDFDVLVVFTCEETAAHFVESMADMFENQDDVTGFVVEGIALLEYLPENFGLLLNAESENAQIVDPKLVLEVLAAGA